MSEVERLRNLGPSPALPIADKRGSKEDSSRGARDDERAPNGPSTKPADNSDPGAKPHPPKSLIDEYA